MRWMDHPSDVIMTRDDERWQSVSMTRRLAFSKDHSLLQGNNYG